MSLSTAPDAIQNLVVRIAEGFLPSSQSVQRWPGFYSIRLPKPKTMTHQLVPK